MGQQNAEVRLERQLVTEGAILYGIVSFSREQTLTELIPVVEPLRCKAINLGSGQSPA